MIKEKLESQVQAGSTAAIAYERGVRPIFEMHKNSLYQTLIAYYREGKHGHELFAVLGELSGLEAMESRITSMINRGISAEKMLNEGARNEHERRREDY